MARIRQSFKYEGVGGNGEPGGYKHREHRSSRGRQPGHHYKRQSRLFRNERLATISQNDIE